MTPSAGEASAAAPSPAAADSHRGAARAACRLGLLVAAVATLSLLTSRAQLAPLAMQVTGSSMAPALPGTHWTLNCRECAFWFPCGIEHPPSAEGAVCPNCGAPGVPLTSSTIPGQRALVAPSVKSPQRWDVVAFRRGGRMEVKRVVGLPGESVALRGGDVWIDGRRAAKTLGQFRQMAVLVHARRYASPRVAPRWRIATGRWPGDLQPGSWLSYRHVPCVDERPPRDRNGPLTDHYGYNQGLSRSLNLVGDVALRCELRASPATQSLRFRLNVDGEPWEWQWKSAGAIALRRRGRDVAAAPAPRLATTRRVVFWLAHLDGQLLWEWNGRVVLRHQASAGGAEAAPAAPREAAAPAELWGVDAPSAEVCRLEIWRDLHYVFPLGGQRAAWPAALSPFECLVMGDNVPVSVDSRHWGPLALDSLVGRVVPDGESREEEAWEVGDPRIFRP